MLATRLPILASTFPRARPVVLFRVGAAAYAALPAAVARTVGHGEIHRGKPVGVRCCGDAK